MNEALKRERRADILIVDDAPENLDVLTEILGNAGYDLRPVTDADAALRAASRKPPDLVLLDIYMPGMDGLALCGKLKTDRRLMSIPVIFISGLTGREDIGKAFSAGGADYIVKPFQPEEVLARVEAQLELRALRSALELYKSKYGAIEKL
jgi:PleD family two-component response regulator